MTASRIIDNKYRIIKVLGQGGMGTVYKAEHVVLRRRVAIKLLNESHSSDPSAVERFMIEAQAAGTIGHPNIVEVQDIGKDGDTIYMVMELLNGRNLSQEIEQHGRLPYKRAVDIMLQVLSALHAAHRKGIIHRDLKTENVFIATDPRGREEIKLLDFGVAKVQRSVDTSVRLTQTGLVVGTPVYMSPEQARGVKDINQQTDIWACGVILYSMLSGKLPFTGNGYNEVISNILLINPPRLTDALPDLPRGLTTAVERALAKKTEVRYQSAAEMIEALMPFHDTHDHTISPRAIVAIASSICPSPPFSGDSTAIDGGQSTWTDAPPGISAHESPLDVPTDSDEQAEDLPDTVPSENFVTIPKLTVMEESESETESPTASYSLPVEGATNRRERSFKRRRMAMMGVGVGFLSVGLILFLVMRTSPGPAPTTPPGPAALPRAIPPNAATSTPVADPSGQRRAEQKDGTSANTDSREVFPGLSTKALMEEEMIELTITDLVPDAAITVDGQAVAPPIIIEKSETPVSLEVTVDGTTRYSATVVPDDDKQIRMSPRSDETPPRHNALKRGIKKKDDHRVPRHRGSGDFAENPF